MIAKWSSSKIMGKLNSYILGVFVVVSISSITWPCFIQVPVSAFFPLIKNCPRLIPFFIPLFEGIKLLKIVGAYSCKRIFENSFGTVCE